MIEIRNLNQEDDHSAALAQVLLDCVQGGASVGFMASVTKQDAKSFFQKVLMSVGRGERLLLAAFTDSVLVGTVQVVPATMENQTHRADISKLLVLRSARGQGIATRLMQEAEESAGKLGKTILVLDTCTGTEAERLYLRLGWTKAGIVPHYALFPDGSSCDTAFFWKRLVA